MGVYVLFLVFIYGCRRATSSLWNTFMQRDELKNGRQILGPFMGSHGPVGSSQLGADSNLKLRMRFRRGPRIRANSVLIRIRANLWNSKLHA